MKFRSLVILTLLGAATSAEATVQIPLIVQEAIYPGSVPGVTRTTDPVTVGIPLPDDAVNGITDVSKLTLTGATVGQFRVLGRWPSGRIKWVLVDTQASLNAGATNTGIALTDGGSGNFGGANMAVDNGASITVSTGGATFTIRKANFNGLDQVVVGSSMVIQSGSSEGLVVTGPAPGQTTCDPCTTVYASSNDASSTAVVEENGPAKVVVKATGYHKDAGGNSYMAFTVRLYFYKDKSFVKMTSTLRNAEHGASGSFATAYKGHRGYELRLTPSIGSSPNYSIGTHTGTPSTGTLGAGESVYLYQAQSQLMKWQDWCGFGCVPYTSQVGYSVVKNGSPVTTGDATQAPQGWADLRGSSGAGLSIGVYQMAAYWPKSLEFNAGGSDVRIGIWPRQNSQPYYQSWPQWSEHDLYLNFHGAALASPANEFLKFQHHLLARASVGHYNSAKVFPYPLLSPAEEDAFYTSTGTAAAPALDTSRFCCFQDVGTTSANWPLNVYRWYAWNAGGGANQTEFRWSYLLNFLSRGMTGRYLNAAHFYRHQSEQTWPHSDGFNWRDRAAEFDGFGRPSATSANANLAHRNWLDQEHGHWYGMTDFYFMSGNEGVKDAMLDGTKDWFLNPTTYQSGAFGGLYNTRSVGVQLMGAARFHTFLAAIGDPDAATVLNNSTNTFNVQVRPELCVSGYPSGCSAGVVNNPSTWTNQGISRTRGLHWGSAGNSGSFCGVQANYRSTATFMQAILAQGILEFRSAKGSGWADYWTATDLAYGLAQFGLSEMFADNGSGRWVENGFRFGIGIDVPSACEENYNPIAQQTVSMLFYAKHAVDGSKDWAQKFRINIQKDAAALGITTSDFGSYQLAAVAAALNSGGPVLQNLPITGFTSGGGGAYTLSWVVPASAQSYRVKWSPKQIVDWIGFNAGTNTFTGDPVTKMPWFAANNVQAPAPAGAGTIQSITVNTGVIGLTASHFSVRAYVGSGSAGGTEPPPPPGSTPTLAAVGGNGQSGAVDSALSTPFTVRVTDGSGSPLSGVAVSFAVAAGGGTLTATQVATNSQGSAASTLILGSTPGTNLVSATASGAVGSPVTFSATAVASSPPPENVDGIQWVRQPHTAAWPAFSGFTMLLFDPTSTQTLLYGVLPGASTIYSSNMFAYRSATNIWTHLGGNGTMATSCSPGTSTWPGDRHPYWQMTIDTKRQVMWLYGGVCSGQALSDLWYMNLRSDPTQNTWQRVQTATIPAVKLTAATVYDPDTDVIFLFGSDNAGQTKDNWVYCPTTLTATPGALTSKQTSAGCARPDDWSMVTVAGGVQPPAVAHPGLVYDPVTKRVIMFGGTASSLASHYNQTWTYNVQTRTWTRKGLQTVAPPMDQQLISGQPAMAYNPLTHKIFYHAPGVSPSDWEYDPVADTWTRVATTGLGPTLDTILVFDPSRNVYLAYTRSGPGQMEIWQGAAGPVPPISTIAAPTNVRIIR